LAHNRITELIIDASQTFKSCSPIGFRCSGRYAKAASLHPIFSTEALNKAAKAAMFASEFKGILLPNGTTRQLLLQYADDTTDMVEGNESNISNLVHLLDNFGGASGLQINWEKSITYWFSSVPGPT
jgi:hypothetical protein